MINASKLKALEIGSKIVCKNGTIELTEVRVNMDGIIDANAVMNELWNDYCRS